MGMYLCVNMYMYMRHLCICIQYGLLVSMFVCMLVCPYSTTVNAQAQVFTCAYTYFMHMQNSISHIYHAY